MILICHLLAGAAIAAKTANPFLALPLAFLSHYFLDLLPQKEYSIDNIKERRWSKSFWDFFKAFLDISLGLFLILLFSENTLLIFIAAFVAILPDGSTVLALIFHKNKWLDRHLQWHQAINNLPKNEKISLFWKIFAQVLVVLIAIYLL